MVFLFRHNVNILFLLVGCSNPTPKVISDKLPYAVIYYPYSELIKISGGILNRKSVEIVITSEDPGLEWKIKVSYRKWRSEYFHNITIYGIPYKKDVITFSVFGSSLLTMYPSKEFNKIYKVTVNYINTHFLY